VSRTVAERGKQDAERLHAEATHTGWFSNKAEATVKKGPKR
jgi:hypothetical protein